MGTKKDSQKMEVSEWTSKNEHFKKLKNSGIKFPKLFDDKQGSTAHDLLKAAIDAFGARICGKLIFSQRAVINDSMEVIVNYIATAISWIEAMIEENYKNAPNKPSLCPFQFDLCLASGKTHLIEQEADVGYPFDDDPDDEKEDGSNKDTKYIDCIGDITKKLKKNNLPHHRIKYKPGKAPQIQRKVYHQPLKELKVQMSKMDDKELDPENYPHKSRVIGFVDRRNGTDEDDVYMYVPPKNCRNIPEDAVDEWYLSSSRTCLLPNMEYGDGKKAQAVKLGSEKNDSESLKETNIGTAFHCKGGLLTMSFIAKEEDAIKCYLYWSGQMTRFMPEDIKVVFPIIFNMEREENKIFVNDETKMNKIIGRMNEVLNDKYFDGLYRKS